jgi:hypothetical protein
MLYEIAEAVPHPDHTVTVTWADGARGVVSMTPFLAKGGVFTALEDPDYFVRECGFCAVVLVGAGQTKSTFPPMAYGMMFFRKNSPVNMTGRGLQQRHRMARESGARTVILCDLFAVHGVPRGAKAGQNRVVDWGRCRGLSPSGGTYDTNSRK